MSESYDWFEQVEQRDSFYRLVNSMPHNFNPATVADAAAYLARFVKPAPKPEQKPEQTLLEACLAWRSYCRFAPTEKEIPVVRGLLGAIMREEAKPVTDETFHALLTLYRARTTSGLSEAEINARLRARKVIAEAGIDP